MGMDSTRNTAQVWRVAGGWHAHDPRWNVTAFGHTEFEAQEALKVARARAERLAAVAAAGVPVDHGGDLPSD
jgi:hypothetical protein